MSAPPVILIHGAFQTAATWDLVATRLRGAHRHVIAAALTGLDQEAGDLTEAVTLDTHVRDVVCLLERDRLAGVTLVGHSYAGMILSGVAEHARERLTQLVYVDAFVPEHGQSVLDLLPEPTRQMFWQLASQGGGWRMRPSARLLDLWGLEEGPARAFVRERLADFTIRCASQPLHAPAHAAHALRRAYIASVKPGYPARAVFAPFAARARGEGWPYYELPSGHDAQAEMPEALSDLLLEMTNQ